MSDTTLLSIQILYSYKMELLFLVKLTFMNSNTTYLKLLATIAQLLLVCQLLEMEIQIYILTKVRTNYLPFKIMIFTVQLSNLSFLV